MEKTISASLRFLKICSLTEMRFILFAMSGLLVPLSWNVPIALSAKPLDPSVLTKYVDPMPILEVMPSVGKLNGVPFYNVGMTQISRFVHKYFEDSNLPTTLWGYGPPDDIGGFKGTYPGRTFEVRKNQQIKVKWTNALPSTHLFPIDTTIHGANFRDPNDPNSGHAPAVRTVVHLHGAHVGSASDGYPEAWFTAGFSKTGHSFTKQIYFYPNTQHATTLWYHDHALGITRLNVYAGLAGFYLIRDTFEDNLNLPKGEFEIPIIIHDRSFNDDGSLFYPAEEIDGVEPSIVPEFFGNTAVVNGKVWPKLEVEPRKYRIRFLNGSNARFYNMQLFVNGNLNKPGPVFHQIGTDGGLLEAPVTINGRLLLAPAERADVIINFSRFEGKSLILHNDAKAPFKGEDTIDDPDVDDEAPLPKIMKFVVKSNVTEHDTSSLPSKLKTLNRITEASAIAERDIILSEGEDNFGRLMSLINNSEWSDPITEKPTLGTNEIWSLINLTEDVHPIHLHLVQFQILDRQALTPDGNGGWVSIPDPNAPRIPPDANEDGRKDTVRANPGEVTRIIAHFDVRGLFVLHCHMLEHEDHEMMRPYKVAKGH
ncbi:MAG: multicopper oxidase [Candidatus Brocadiaceae bacterium]|uniref:multicopper oxidase family protein n=1 Tax=Candidatus Wunengus sp. YC61 TaxID=3367698 RepID=UPI0027270283|nr:multicopper oxidase [Candidatus Brocadiaceae bacterium]